MMAAMTICADIVLSANPQRTQGSVFVCECVCESHDENVPKPSMTQR